MISRQRMGFKVRANAIQAFKVYTKFICHYYIFMLDFGLAIFKLSFVPFKSLATLLSFFLPKTEAKLQLKQKGLLPHNRNCQSRSTKMQAFTNIEEHSLGIVINYFFLQLMKFENIKWESRKFSKNSVLNMGNHL